MYQYKLSQLGCSSSRVGNCEICNIHVSDAYIQTKSKEYTYNNVKRYSQVSMIVGHKDCLKSIR